MKRWIFFDLGSTLLDETERVNERIDATAKLLHMNTQTFRTQLEQAAKTHPYAIEMKLPNGVAWAPWPKRLDPLYPAALSVLDKLYKKYQLGVIANHGKDTVQHLGISKFFTTCTTSEAVGYKKPDLRIFELAVTQANCLIENSIMVGDRLDNDIYPAKKIGMKTIWIKLGYGGMVNVKKDEYKPDFEIDSLVELLCII